jgi:hypothetical protein
VHDLRRAGSRYSIAWSADGAWLELLVDGKAERAFAVEQVAEALRSVIGQIQSEVMETKTEPWPLCPQHYHELSACPVGDWFGWCCPSTEAVVAEFGRL